MKDVRGLVFGFEKFHYCHYFPNGSRVAGYSMQLETWYNFISYKEIADNYGAREVTFHFFYYCVLSQY